MIRNLIVRTSARHSVGVPAAILTAAAVLIGLASIAGGAWAADPSPAPKLVRQIGVMESIFDKVLIDSPNFLVSGGGDNTRGIYLDEVGVLFTFDASLTGPSFNFQKYFGNLEKQFQIQTDKDGNDVIVLKKGDQADEDDEDAKEAAKEAEEARREAKEAMKEAAKARAEAERAIAEARASGWASASGDDEEPDYKERYEAGKEELIDAVLDYGETLTSLRSNQSVVVAAILKDNDFFREREISRLVIRASMGDLRAYAEGGLNEDQMRSRLQIQEY